MKTYENYHTHKDGSNVYVPDTPMMFSDYLKRTEELGHNSISSIEHGWVGNYFSDYLQLEKHNKKREKEGKPPLKWIYGGEFYWVKDRKTKDDANCHIIILARNENGRKNINRIMSECNKTGYYKRPRLDLELIYSLPKDDVFITTACVAGWKYEDSEQIFIDMNNYFNHFYLEVQAHNTLKQKELNKKILKLSKSEGIKIIAGVDSHIIDNSQIEERDDFLRSNGVVYEDEEGWDLDFPDYETLFSRFQKQGILSDEEIEIALENTKDVLKFEDIILDKEFIYKGDIVENYVQQQLNVNFEHIYYWKNDNTAEVDFIIQNEDGLIPIEVKAGDSVKSKSLNLYMKQFKPKYGIKLCTKNFGYVNGLKTVPLYATFLIKKKENEKCQ